jgi:TRAP-type uncharacterized transport system fused permease subunit
MNHPKPFDILAPVLALLAAAVMLGFAAWGRFEYNWYNNMRIIVCCCLAYAAFDAHRRKLALPTFVLAVVAVLFNPIPRFGCIESSGNR